MPRKKKASLTDRLRDLGGLADRPATPERDAAIGLAVEDREPHVVARAVQLVRELEIDVPPSVLEDQFAYFVERGADRDPGCVAKLALVELIDHRDLPLLDLLLTGASLVQEEGVWGGTEDTAIGVRSTCTLALVQHRSSRAPGAIVARLTEASPIARRAGVEALCAWADPLWTPAMLRFRLAVGESELDVLVEIHVGLLELDREATLAELREALRSGSAAQVEVAALSLGTARVEDALPWLVEAVHLPHRRREVPTLVAAVALLRIPSSRDALVDFVRTLRWSDARVALEALEPYLTDAAIAERIEAAAAANPDPAVAAGLRRLR